MSDLSTLLDAARRGDSTAMDKLFSRLYAELHRLAHSRLIGGSPVTLLDTTSLLHESYLRMLNAGQLDIPDRSHFLAYAARVMRSIVIDFVRRQRAERRGGDAVHLTLNTDIAESIHVSEDQLIRLDDALHDLGQVDERLVRVTEMRYFAGLSEAEIGEALGITERTVRRDWEKARLLLLAALR
jgi:RNA polymerase sigma factor (TIGR02999 family)